MLYDKKKVMPLIAHKLIIIDWITLDYIKFKIKILIITNKYELCKIFEQ